MRSGEAGRTLLIAAGLLAGGAAFWFLGEGRERPAASPSAGTVALSPANTSPDPANETPTSALRERSGGRGEVLRPEGNDRGTGRLFVRVVDDRTGEPLPGMRFLVACERPYPHPLVAGVTDENGTAGIADLPEDLLIVETERRPPHCASLDAVWLPDGGTAEVTVRAGYGGRISGRVVDDAGHPLPDIPVRAPVAPGDPFLFHERGFLQNDLEEVARTDAEGRFAIPAMICRRRGIRVVDGKLRHERTEPFRVNAQSDWGAFAGTTVEVAEGETAEIPDLVLKRATRLEGRVHDGEGRPRAGILVSGNRSRQRAVRGEVDLDPDLWIPPGQAGFELLPQEALTDGAGRFSLETGWQSLTLRGSGRELSSGGPKQMDPGGMVHDCELVLPPMVAFVLELEDAGGQLITHPGRVSVTAIEGEFLTDDARTSPIPGGAYEVRYERAAAIDGVRVRAAGHAPVDVPLGPGFANGQTVRVRLEELPEREEYTLPVRLIRSAGAPEPVELEVRACLLTSKQCEEELHGCCGVGDREAMIVRKTAACTLRLPLDRPYWVRVLRNGDSGPEPIGGDHGPYSKGSAVELTLNVPGDFPGTEPEDPGTVTLRVLDSVTGESLGARLLFRDSSGRTKILTLSGDQEPQEFPLPGGSWELRVELADRYRRPPLLRFGLAAGQALSLGDIRVQHEPEILGRLLDAEGHPASGAVSLLDGERYRMGVPDEEGRFRIPADPAHLPTPWFFLFSVGLGGAHPGSPDSIGVQAFSSSPWPLEEVREFRLDPWCRLEVAVTGLDPSLPGLSVILGDQDGTNVSSVCERLEKVDGTHLFRFWVGPGVYTVTSRGSLYELPGTRVEVGPEGSTVTLAVRERSL